VVARKTPAAILPSPQSDFPQFFDSVVVNIGNVTVYMADEKGAFMFGDTISEDLITSAYRSLGA